MLRKIFVLNLALFLVMVLSNAEGATFTVGNKTDAVDINPGDGICDSGINDPKDGSCTLRAAIMEANASLGLDTIEIGIGTYYLTLTGSDDTAHAGDLDIIERVNFYGSNSGSVIIDGSQLEDRIIHIKGGAAVNFKDVILKNGHIPVGTGGGILNEGGNVSIRNVDIEECSASHGGGGIYMTGGSLIVYAGTGFNLRSNSTTWENGGGIYLEGGTFTIPTGAHASFTSNLAEDAGGGIYASNSTLALVNAEFTGNWAENYGGGIFTTGSTLSLSDSFFIENTSDAFAGAVYSDSSSTAEINSTVFERNSSLQMAGAIYSSNELNISSSYFIMNTASISGGAIVQWSGNLAIEGTLFDSNSAESFGAVQKGFDSFNSLAIYASTFKKNSSTVGEAGAVGIYNSTAGYSNTVGIEETAFYENNAATNGGGLSVEDLYEGELVGLDFVIDNSLFHKNSAGYDGGALYISSNTSTIFTLEMNNTTVSANTADHDAGGIHMNWGDFSLNNVTIVQNSAGSTGGGIVSYSDGTIQNTILAQNTSGTGNTDDCRSTLMVSDGYNLFGDIDGCDMQLDSTDLHGDSSGSGILDPEIDRLADNGGGTWTHALLSTSPAIDSGNPAGCSDGTNLLTTDQRGTGYSRHFFMGRCDMGAYEYHNVVIAP